MDTFTLTLIATGLIFVLLLLGVPVFAALGLSGLAGIILLEDLPFVLNRLKSFSYTNTAEYLLTVVPLFILMGALPAPGLPRPRAPAWRPPPPWVPSPFPK